MFDHPDSKSDSEDSDGDESEHKYFDCDETYPLFDPEHCFYFADSCFRDGSIPLHGEELIPALAFRLIKLDPSVPLFTHPPCVEDISQRLLGNCYFIAALQTMVMRDPSYIQSMFKELEDGRIAVRYYWPTEDPQIFAPQWVIFDRTIVETKPKSHKANWVKILETTHAIWRLHLLKYYEAQRNTRHQSKHAEYDLSSNRIIGMDLFWQNKTLALKDYTFIDIIEGGFGTEPYRAYLGCQSQRVPLKIQGKLLTILNFLGEKPTPELINAFGEDKRLAQDYVKNCNLSGSYQRTAPGKKFDLVTKIRKFEATAKDVHEYFRHYSGDLAPQTIDYIHQYANQYIFPSEAMGQYTAEEMALYVCMQKQLQNGELLTAASKDRIEGESKGVVLNHEYAVESVFQEDKHLFVQVRNPWQLFSRAYAKDMTAMRHYGIFGSTPEDRGVFKIELADFMRLFYDFSTTNIQEQLASLRKKREEVFIMLAGVQSYCKFMQQDLHLARENLQRLREGLPVKNEAYVYAKALNREPELALFLGKTEKTLDANQERMEKLQQRLRAIDESIWNLETIVKRFKSSASEPQEFRKPHF